MGLSSSSAAAAWSETNGGATTMSVPPVSTASRSSAQKPAASPGPLNIFQLPAISKDMPFEPGAAASHPPVPAYRGNARGWRAAACRKRAARSCHWERHDAGKLLALEQLQRGAPAGRDPVDTVGEAEFLHGPDGITATHDRMRIGGGYCFRDGLGAFG